MNIHIVSKKSGEWVCVSLEEEKAIQALIGLGTFFKFFWTEADGKCEYERSSSREVHEFLKDELPNSLFDRRLLEDVVFPKPVIFPTDYEMRRQRRARERHFRNMMYFDTAISVTLSAILLLWLKRVVLG